MPDGRRPWTDRYSDLIGALREYSDGTIGRWTGGTTGAIIRRLCRVHRLYALASSDPRGGRAALDAQEIKTAVAHQDAAQAAAEAPFVNLADPARALGPDGRPAVSRRAPICEDVPDEKWNDWRWQLSNRVNDLEEIERILELTDEEREGLSAPDKFRVDITPYFISLIDPKDPDDPIRRQVIPTRPRAARPSPR